MKKYYAMVTVAGKFANADECERFFEDEEWYFQDSETAGKKIVPLFPYLQKMMVHRHQFFGCVLNTDAKLGHKKVFKCQIMLEVSGHSDSEIRREIQDGDWLLPNCGVTVYPPTLFLTGYEDHHLNTIEQDIRSGDVTNNLDIV